jgi:hypothetical protein
VPPFLRRRRRRRAGSEYLPIAFLHDDSLAVVTTIPNRPAARMGFVFINVQPQR